MTFNTTSLPLWRALQERKLLERVPPRPLGESVRYVLVTPEIDDLLDGRAQFGVFPSWSADKLIAQFSAGWTVRVSRKITKRKPEVEKIDGYDEVWALCARSPPPGWRILGRFYKRDVFIALRAWDKHRLSNNYGKAAHEVIEDWKRLFGSSRVPVTGVNVSDYISGLVRDVDETN